MELLSGVPARERGALGRRLSALPVARPTDETWALMERWLLTAADRGHRFGVGDLLIAALPNAAPWSGRSTATSSGWRT
jgi:hypothetical protein